MQSNYDKRLHVSDAVDDIDLNHENKIREKDKIKYKELLDREDRVLSMGERARKYRILANYTLNEVSKKIDISQNVVVELEDHNQVLTMKKANELAILLNVDSSVLFLSSEELQKLKFAELLNTEDALLSVGECLKKYRIKANYTLKSFAEKMNIPTISLKGIENDKYSLSFKKAEVFAKELQIDVSLIYSQTQDKENENNIEPCLLSKEEKQKLKFAELLNTEDALLSVGERLRKYRIKAGYTLQSFSKKIKMSMSSLGGVEKDNYNLSFEKAKTFAKELNIDVSLIYLSKLEKEKTKFADILKKEDADLSLGGCIKKHRLLNGFALDSFAEAVDISSAYLRKIENDEHLISHDKAIKISELINIDIEMRSISEVEKQKQKFADLLNTNDELLSVGERIRKYRIINNYTLKTFAEKCNIVDTHLCNIEWDKSKASTKLTKKFADILNINESLLIKNVNNAASKLLGRNEKSQEQQKKSLCKKYSDLIKIEDSLLSPGKLVKKYRVLNGYSLKSLSEEINITSPYLSEIEKDKHNISYDYAQRIADILGLDVSILSKTEEEKLKEKYSELLKTEDECLLVGERIKKYRITKGYTLISMARELGITGPYLIEVEKSNRFLSNDKNDTLASILGVDIKIITPTESEIKKQRDTLLQQAKNQSAKLQKRQDEIQTFINTDDSLLSIGDRIKKYRLLNNHTLKSLAKEINITYSYLGQIERDKLDLSNSKTKDLADVLKIDASLITINEEEKQKQKYSDLLQKENDTLSIGERIKKFRIKNGYTLKTFSEQCDITKSHLGKIEGNKSIASPKLTKKIASILNIDYTLIYISEEEAEERKASYMSKINKKKMEKYSYLLNATDSSLTTGEYVRKHRLINNFTLKELSKEINVSCSNLSEFEMDKRGLAREDAEKIAKILNLDLSLLYK